MIDLKLLDNLLAAGHIVDFDLDDQSLLCGSLKKLSPRS